MTTSDAPSPADLPSQRGEIWNDTDAIARHRAMTPSQRLTLAIEVSRAALLFARAGGAVDVASTFDPAGLVAALKEACVDYVIVGGLAGAAHGVVRASADIDLVPSPSETLAALSSLGAAYADDVIRTRWGDVHFQRGLSYLQLRDNALAVRLGDANAAVCSLADFRSMKLALARPRDLIDLAELDELHAAST
ncbi:hypothetical protein OM076_37415 [Solirubrobacter ginsenosidimutans]|uniref:Nucleotidyltransferase family protein n=1 Tax=Solirubrobacter ginsenosidimutans TaxID=490573 RepID=A0A9X3S4M9_9ACTN|nr:hypothetical protein [Solirubrobacter ginsenosidimutans]MDA0166004.1 hypothetical protein [Solirubrobacter ginsenosidimutans]